MVRIVGAQILVVERRQRADDTDHHRHRVRVATEAAEQILDLLMHHGVVGHALVEVLELDVGRQLAVEDQIGHLEERAVLGQILDGVAAMQQHALVAVDEGDVRAAARGGGEAGVVSEHPRLAVQLANVDHVGAERALEDRKIGRLAVRGRNRHGLARCLLTHPLLSISRGRIRSRRTPPSCRSGTSSLGAQRSGLNRFAAMQHCVQSPRPRCAPAPRCGPAPA